MLSKWMAMSAVGLTLALSTGNAAADRPLPITNVTLTCTTGVTFDYTFASPTVIRLDWNPSGEQFHQNVTLNGTGTFNEPIPSSVFSTTGPTDVWIFPVADQHIRTAGLTPLSARVRPPRRHLRRRRRRHHRHHRHPRRRRAASSSPPPSVTLPTTVHRATHHKRRRHHHHHHDRRRHHHAPAVTG